VQNGRPFFWDVTPCNFVARCQNFAKKSRFFRNDRTCVPEIMASPYCQHSALSLREGVAPWSIQLDVFVFSRRSHISASCVYFHFARVCLPQRHMQSDMGQLKTVVTIYTTCFNSEATPFLPHFLCVSLNSINVCFYFTHTQHFERNCFRNVVYVWNEMVRQWTKCRCVFSDVHCQEILLQVERKMGFVVVDRVAPWQVL
jgi:hypothetical protein